MAANTVTAAVIHQTSTEYPILKPVVNTRPETVGPIARARDAVDEETPLTVPSTLVDGTRLANSMAIEGYAKLAKVHFQTMMIAKAIVRKRGSEIVTTNGVMIYNKGYNIASNRNRRSVPSIRVAFGNSTTVANIEYPPCIDMTQPICLVENPKPPTNLSELESVVDVSGVLKKIGSSESKVMVWLDCR